ncbi:uncharacterized protein sS8_1065 [Methylocaldum marinum]|uniref:RHS protein conserved region domain-containing protein n=1 Tax=Methylocaldum marinum TaxID=1432792 RepID=A0A250KN63_9GAMM|nr:RHS repeat-associated core domain-containing protein [Methylocaldum marinum]BBA33027.1 uncharacterized protein sS8_1065 [Methylocaldum marinum]
MHLRWDANQRLIESRLDGVSTRYRYDPLGRRIEKRTGDQITAFAWDGDALVGDWIEDPTDPVVPAKGMAREWVYYPETFEPLALLGGRSGPDTLLHYHNDPNGCPIRLTDSKGEVLWAASYTAWGQIARLHVGYVDNPIRLQGQYEDEETQLAQNLSRYFDAAIGCFLSQDPLGLIVGPNPYEFAPNALVWVDPLGLACGRAVRQNSRGQWIDARGRFAKKPNVSLLPRLKGKSARQIEKILRKRGHTRTNPLNPRNQRWVHPDGSEVQIHAYGNVKTGPYKAGNNAHVHKSLGKHGDPGTIELADDGKTPVNAHSKEAHIGIKNPDDFPTVAGRPHGT